MSEEVKKAKACERSRLWRLEHPDHNKEYYATHREEISERVKRYRDNKGREPYQEQSRKWKVENPERVKEYQQQWDNEHPGYYRDYSRDYRKENPEANRAAVKKWKRTHPEYERVWKNRRRARLLGNGGSFTLKDINDIFNEQDGFCFYCGKLLYSTFDSDVHVDHKTPLSRGGSNNKENIALACAGCNLRKHAKTAEEFFLEIGG